MRQAVMCLGVTFALVIGVAASAHAQQGQGNTNAQEKKQKRQPNQVPDNGSGQSDLAADTTFERVVTSVPVTVRADGTIVAELNDSFMEAQTAARARQHHSASAGPSQDASGERGRRAPEAGGGQERRQRPWG